MAKAQASDASVQTGTRRRLDFFRGFRAPRRQDYWGYILVFVFVAVVVAGLIWYRVATDYRVVMNSWQASQSGLADDRVHMVSSWLDERQADAQMLAGDPMVQAVLQERLELNLPRQQADASREHLMATLDRCARTLHYAGIYILNHEGRVVARSTGSVELDPSVASSAREAARTRRTLFDLLGPSPEKSLVSTSVLVYPEAHRVEPPPVLGVVVLLLDPTRTLFPLLTDEPVPTPTGETVLIRQEGNEAVYVSPLRLPPPGTTQLRRPLDALGFAARAALEGRQAYGEFTDYRGVWVLATTRRIALTGWGLVRKVDRKEALADFHRTIRLEIVAAALALLALGGLLMASRRNYSSRALKEQEAHLREVLESVADAMTMVDHEGRIVLVSRQMEMLSGYTREELLGQPVSLLMPERVRREEAAQYGQYFGDRAFHRAAHRRESIRRRKDGSEYPVELTLSPIQIAGQILVCAAVRDITIRKDAEEHLVQMESRYRGLLEAAPDAMLVVNQGGDIVLLNLQAEKQFGYRRDELLGKNVKNIILQGFAERLIADAFRSAEDALAQEIGTGIEITGRRKDGSEFPIQIMLSPLKSTEGILVTAAIRDITGRQRAEEALRQKAEELARSNAELEQFAYIASHDLQAPLRTAGSFAQLLQKRYQGKLDQTADEFIGYIVDGTQHMQRLINDLLAFARVGTRGKVFEPVDCAAVLAQAVAHLQIAIEEGGAVVTHDPLPVLNADPGQLGQLLQNLIGNSIKFHAAARPRIHVSAQRTKEGWVLSVQDNGIGIDPQFSDRIFEVFQRLHTRAEYPGTGIGLAICKKIVQRHGGRIWVESAPGKGATFSFTIPPRHGAAGAGPGRLEPATGSGVPAG